MDQFRFVRGEVWALPKPNQDYDFSQTYTYSDLDTSRWEFDLGGRYWFKERYWVRAGYRYVDYTDDAPYLYDTSGSIDYWNIGLGMAF